MWTVRASLVVLVSLLGVAANLVSPDAPKAAAAAQDALHQVMPGDDLRLIAGYYYGDTRQWGRIWQANRDQISNPNRIQRGALLRISDAFVPDEPYADFVARVRQPGPPPGVPATAETPPAPAEKPTPGAVMLRYKPAKGFVQTSRLAITQKIVREEAGRPQQTDLNVAARLRLVVEDVAGDGAVRVSLSHSEGPRPADVFSFANEGLPEPGETLRLMVSPLNKVLRVEGKPADSSYYSPSYFYVVYPEAPVPVGGRWQFEHTLRQAGSTQVAFGQCTLLRREQLRKEDGYRIQCQERVSIPSGGDMRGSASGETTAVVSVRDGVLMFYESVSRATAENPTRKLKVSVDSRVVLEQETAGPPAPPTAQAAAPPAPPTTAPAKAAAPPTPTTPPAPPSPRGLRAELQRAMEFFTAWEFLLLVVILGTALSVYYDAAKHKVGKIPGRSFFINFSPGGWAAWSILTWPIAGLVYLLVVRKRLIADAVENPRQPKGKVLFAIFAVGLLGGTYVAWEFGNRLPLCHEDAIYLRVAKWVDQKTGTKWPTIVRPVEQGYEKDTRRTCRMALSNAQGQRLTVTYSLIWEDRKKGVYTVRFEGVSE